MEAIKKTFGTFGSHLAFSTIGIGVWSVVLFVTNIYAGRFLGPEEYGRYALTLSIASIMMIPMLFGLNTSMIKFGSGTIGKERSSVLATGTVLVVSLAVASSFVFWLVEPLVTEHWPIVGALWVWAIILALGLVMQYLADAFFRSLKAFQLQSMWLIIGAVTLLIALLALFFFAENHTFRAYVSATVISYGVLLIGATILFVRHASFTDVSRPRALELGHFGFYAMFGSIVGTLIMNVDRLMIGSFLGESSVGVYMAYSIAATVIILKLTEVFLNVFFPTVSSMDRAQKAVLFVKMQRPLALTFIFLVFLTVISTVFTLFLFGEDYPIAPVLLGLFSVQAPLIAIASILAWLISSCGVYILRKMTLFGMLLLVVNIGCNALLIPVFGIAGAVVATIITYVMNYAYAVHRIRIDLLYEQ